MFVSQTGVGKTIFDLVDEISSSISDVDVLFKLREETTQTIGSHIEEVSCSLMKMSALIVYGSSITPLYPLSI